MFFLNTVGEMNPCPCANLCFVSPIWTRLLCLLITLDIMMTLC